MEQRSPAAYVAESLGTFALVFFISASFVLFISPQGGADFAVVGLVNAFVLLVVFQTLSRVSGAHLNPAVTLGLTAIRKIRPNDAAVYILLQLAGGVLGGLTTKFLVLDRVVNAANDGVPALRDTLVGGSLEGVVAEGLGAFLLVAAYVAIAHNPKASSALRDWAGLAIGGTLGLVVMILGPLTGGSVNPARWFGPALVAGEWDDFWLYIVGPAVGGVLAALLFWYLFLPAEQESKGAAAPGQ